MFSVIKTGGKQYVVKPGQTLRVEKIESALGQRVALETLLTVQGEETETPTLTWAPQVTAVAATLNAQTRTKKIPVVKYKPKVHYRRNKSHRQQQTVLEVQ